MRTVTWVTTFVVVAAVPVCAARAQSLARGTVVRIDGEDVFVDAGDSRVEVGDEIAVLREIQIRHPTSRRVLSDRFALGRLRVVTVARQLSVARVVGPMWRPVAVGDVVELPVREPATAPDDASPPARNDPPSGALAPPVSCAPAGIGTPASPVACRPDATTAELLAVFESTLGRTPEDRVRIFYAYLRDHPDSLHRTFVEQEMAALQSWLASVGYPAGVAVAHRTIVRARRAAPLDVSVLAQPEAGLRALTLQVRAGDAAGGARAYRTLPMTLDERGHARARVPRDLLAAESFEYFVEGTARDGAAVAVLGSAATPVHVTLELPPGQRTRERERSRVRVSAEVVDFDMLSGRDWYLLTEGDFLYRLQTGMLHGIRVGYGVYRGEGGTVEQLDELGMEPQPAGYTYGYTELELHPFDLFSIIFRVTVGLGRPDDVRGDQRDGLRGGVQVRGRIGRERSTHLLFAAETVPELGQRALLGLAWEVIPDVPMAGEVHVTDQPVAGDLAVRLVYEAGYRVSETLSLSARASYQGRTIDHTGIGGGFAATFDW